MLKTQKGLALHAQSHLMARCFLPGWALWLATPYSGCNIIFYNWFCNVAEWPPYIFCKNCIFS
ncbi:hypothetical protein A4R89_03560 [Acetobacter ascendens]|nr:hypothetical protein A4R89_03560 [Acetobacter ascendens]